MTFGIIGGICAVYYMKVMYKYGSNDEERTFETKTVMDENWLNK